MKKWLFILLLFTYGLSQAYDYSLLDINPNSDTDGEIISPDFFEDHVTLHYFGHQD